MDNRESNLNKHSPAFGKEGHILFNELPREEREMGKTIFPEVLKYRFEGEGLEDTTNQIVGKGLSNETARILIAQADLEIQRYKQTPEWQQISARLRKKAIRNILLGSMWAVIGISITVISLVNANSNGYFRLAWGAIFGGLIEIVIGIVEWLKFKGGIPMNS